MSIIGWTAEKNLDYRFDKINFAKIKASETGKSIDDHSTLIYNNHITVREISPEAWSYLAKVIL